MDGVRTFLGVPASCAERNLKHLAASLPVLNTRVTLYQRHRDILRGTCGKPGSHFVRRLFLHPIV